MRPAPVHVDLLRHGETSGGAVYRGVGDDPLTPAGRAQMSAALADGGGWDAVVTSPLRRCAEFARAVAEQHDIPLTIDARLREMDFGAWEGRSAEQIMRDDPQCLTRFWQDPWRHPPPGAESLVRVRARVLEVWGELVARGQSLLVISHGGPLRVILCQLLGHPTARMLELPVPHAARCRVRLTAGSAPCLEPPVGIVP